MLEDFQEEEEEGGGEFGVVVVVVVVVFVVVVVWRECGFIVYPFTPSYYNLPCSHNTPMLWNRFRPPTFQSDQYISLIPERLVLLLRPLV